MERPERFASKLAFVLSDGHIVFPVRHTNRETWMKTFRVGLAAHAKDDIVEVDHEDELIAMIVKRRCAVRCSSLDGTRRMLLSADDDAVRQVVLSEPENLD